MVCPHIAPLISEIYISQFYKSSSSNSNQIILKFNNFCNSGQIRLSLLILPITNYNQLTYNPGANAGLS